MLPKYNKYFAALIFTVAMVTTISQQSSSPPQIISADTKRNLISSTAMDSPQTTKPNEEVIWYPAHRAKGNDGEDIIFIDPLHGWKMASGGVRTGANEVIVYKTEDGGSNWSQISKTFSKEAPSGSLPKMGLKTGITFLDTKTGWVGMDEPAPQPEIYLTHDGGQTWERQALPIMDNSGITSFVLSPPSFFTKQDGIILFQDNHTLIYITQNGGKTWELIEQPSHKGSRGNLSWDFNGMDRMYDPVMNGYVTIYGATWVTKDGGLSWSKSP